MITILVVDDAAIIREPIAAALRLRGYRTICAGDGREALQRLTEVRPDLILLDVAMPVMDGLTFLRHLNATLGPDAVPVILLTAVTEKDYILQAARLGVRDYLLKSRFSLTELVTRIENRLNQAHVEPQPALAAATAAVTDAPATPPLAGTSAAPATAETDAAASSPATRPTRQAQTPQPDSGPGRLTPPSASNAPPAEAVKALKPVMSRSDISEHLEEIGELKALSPTVGQLMKLTAQPNCSIDQITRIIRQDQGLSLKILKLANSVVYSRGDPVETIHKAIMRIGLSQIRQAVVNMSVMDHFTGNDCGDYLVTSLFWEHSIACGLIAAATARHVGANEMEVDSAFTSGLLHDVGRLVYAEAFPEIYQQVLEEAHQMQLPLDMVESRMLLVNHADAMDRVLHSWNFPKHLINPIAFHHLSLADINRMARSNAREVTLLAVANRLAHALLLGHSGNTALQPTQDLLRSLNVNEQLFKDLENDIPDQSDDIRLAVLSSTHESTWRSQRDLVREQLVQPLRPLYVSVDPHLDSFQLLFNRLRVNDASAPPNIAVVHLTEIRERSILSEQLLTAEREAAVGPLPLLLIAPRQNLQLEDAAIAGRQTVVLPTPTTVLRLLDAINSLLAGA